MSGSSSRTSLSYFYTGVINKIIIWLIIFNICDFFCEIKIDLSVDSCIHSLNVSYLPVTVLGAGDTKIKT